MFQFNMFAHFYGKESPGNLKSLFQNWEDVCKHTKLMLKCVRHVFFIKCEVLLTNESWKKAPGLRPIPVYTDIFEFGNFFFVDPASIHTYPVYLLPRVEIFEYAMNSEILCGC